MTLILVPAMANRLLELWVTKHKLTVEERKSEVAAGGACLLAAPRAPPLKENPFFLLSRCFPESSDV